MEKKFYQNYVVSSKEEAFVILKAHVDAFYGGKCDGYLDEATCGSLVSEEDFGRDKVDNSFCFLVTKEIDNVLYTWINCENLSEVSALEGFDSLDCEAVKDSLYEKVVGTSDIETLYKKDLEIFGKGAAWYKDSDSFLYELFKKHWNLEG